QAPRALSDDLRHVEGLARADRHGVGHRRDVQYVAGLAVRRRVPEPQALALADRVAVRPLVLAEEVPVGVHDPAGRGAETAREEALGVAVGDEADVVTVG